jgi:ATP-dependent DNA helicase RecG
MLIMDDEALLRSAGLYQKDYQTGMQGFTLAAALLLGKDEVIQSIVPYYKTDAIYRVVNIDRYDDRDDIRTNLIEAYERLMAFIAKHLPEKFYQEDSQRVNLRDRLFRKITANLLVHREYANAFPAKLVIEKERVFTENWNKPHINGIIDPASFTPFPKNPVIARFFKEIGRIEELGSGIRNTFKYAAIYSNGKTAEFKEDDVFTSIIPIDYSILHISYTDSIGSNEVTHSAQEEKGMKPVDDTINDGVNVNDGVNDTINDIVNDTVKKRMKRIIELLYQSPGRKKGNLVSALGVSDITFKRDLQKLKGLIEFRGPLKTGGYYLTNSIKEKLDKLKA